jgi:APA family basic amino acid/polyamine antiporter
MNDSPERNGLERRLGIFPLTNIVVANMIGAGIFTTSGLLMGDLHDPLLMLILWVAAGAVALSGALCYGEVGAAIPRAGGEYAFLSRLFHPLFGFLSGWLSIFAGFSAPIAASAIGFSEYFTRAFPQTLRLGILNPETEAVWLRKIFAIFIILVFTAIHRRGIVFGSRVQNLLTVLKIVLIIGLIGFGLSSGNGSFAHLTQGSGPPAGFSGWRAAALALMWILFAYSGWNAAAYIGSEVRDPRRNLPRSLIWGTLIVITLYVGINLLYVYAVPPNEMEGVISIGGLAARYLFGPAFERILSLLISFALFSSLSAFIILGPRVYYSMSRDGYFFPFAGKVHPVFKVPSQSILLQGLVAALLVCLGTFDQILTYMGFSLGIFPLMVVWGVFKLRRSGGGPYRMPGYPLAPVFYLAAGIGILVLSFIERPVESTIALLTTALGIPAFFWFRSRYKPGRKGAETEADPA